MAFLICFQNTGSCQRADHVMVFRVDFQNHFNNDVISCAINGCDVFENVILVSDEIDGFTGVSIEAHAKGGELSINYNNQRVHCSYKLPFTIVITVNGVPNVHTVDVKNGKFIGFDLSKENELKLYQSQFSFEYD